MESFSPNYPRLIYGVDFSGAAQAGKKIWIAGGIVDGDILRIEACFRAADLPDSGQGRDRCMAALRRFIRGEKGGAFGLDFPFGLPRDFVSQTTWRDFVLAFPHRYVDPEHFRRDCRSAADGSEWKRNTDQVTRTPFSPYNIRLFRQTYFGIRDILAPLVQEDSVCVLPMQSPIPNRPWLLEICPASTLKHEELNDHYKGKGSQYRAARARILEGLEARAPLSILEPLRATVLDEPEGDALDSILAAFAVLRAIQNPANLDFEGSAIYRIEGRVYV